MKKRIYDSLLKGVELRKKIADIMIDDIEKAANMCLETIRSGGKILLMGNGGSAADAQHIAAELVGRYLLERNAIPAIALSTDTSIITAIGNDYGYNIIFERQIEALGRENDIVFGISTSGNSENIYRAFIAAEKRNIKTIGLLGKDGGKIGKVCDMPLIVPSEQTPRVQEIHIAIGHIICEEIERGVHADQA